MYYGIVTAFAQFTQFTSFAKSERNTGDKHTELAVERRALNPPSNDGAGNRLKENQCVLEKPATD